MNCMIARPLTMTEMSRSFHKNSEEIAKGRGNSTGRSMCLAGKTCQGVTRDLPSFRHSEAREIPARSAFVHG
jgi:hypothetical protein